MCSKVNRFQKSCTKVSSFCIANQKELVTDLITKAKQIEYLINSLPEPEPEEEQVVSMFMVFPPFEGLSLSYYRRNDFKHWKTRWQ